MAPGVDSREAETRATAFLASHLGEHEVVDIADTSETPTHWVVHYRVSPELAVGWIRLADAEGAPVVVDKTTGLVSYESDAS